MRNIVSPAQIYPALQALLGLPDHCISFDLRVGAEEYGVTVTCEHYLSLDAAGIAELTKTFGEYELVRREQQPTEMAFKVYSIDSVEFQAERAKVIGFDAWMRERTDAAHVAYMAAHASGGIDYSKRRKFATGGMVTGHRLVGEAA